MGRQWMVMWAVVMLVSGRFLGPVSAQAGRVAQDDPVAQCARGYSFIAMDGLGKRVAAGGRLCRPRHSGVCEPGWSGAVCVGAGVAAIQHGRPDWGVGGKCRCVGHFSSQRQSTVRRHDAEQYRLGSTEARGATARRWSSTSRRWRSHGEVEDRKGEGVALNNIGMVHDSRGRYAEALEAYQQALAIRRDVGDRAGEGVTLNNIGQVYETRGATARRWRVTSRRWRSSARWATGQAKATALNNTGCGLQRPGALRRGAGSLRRRWRSCARWAIGPVRARR